MRHAVVVVCKTEKKLGELLPRLGEGADRALADGRVFIGARRAGATSDPIASGDQVALYSARDDSGQKSHVLFDSGGVVAVYKPAPVATIADQHGREDALDRQAAILLGLPEKRLVPTSRLDIGVSGVVLFAASDAARHRLQRAREEGRYRRHYVAIASRSPDTESGFWTAPIGRDRDPRRRRAFGRDAVDAKTAYRVCGNTPNAALLAVEPVTGRTHQIRVHASYAGCPLWGDAAYGGPARVVSATGRVNAIGRIALHAAWVEVPNEEGRVIRLEASIPDDFAAIWIACGGAATTVGLASDPLSQGPV